MPNFHLKCVSTTQVTVSKTQVPQCSGLFKVFSTAVHKYLDNIIAFLILHMHTTVLDYK